MWNDFDYLRPRTLKMASSLVRKYGSAARILAGGTDLLVKMKQGVEKPSYVIDLKGIPKLDQLTYENGTLRIGALVNLSTLEKSALVREKFATISEAVGSIGSLQVRNRGTVGGNICNASPAADSPAALIAMGAKAKIYSPENPRIVPLESFFTGVGKTVLQPGEFLTEIEVPEPVPRSGSAFIKHGVRNAMEIALINVGASVVLNGEGVCTDARIVLGSVAPTHIRARKAEASLVGKKIDDSLIEKAAEMAREEISPISDIRASADYRREVTKVLVKRALQKAVSRAIGGSKQ